jgi:hypothetical protein
MFPQSKGWRFGNPAVVSILGSALLAGCAITVPIQSTEDKARAISELRVGDSIKYAYESKNGWGENGCRLTSIDKVGFTCDRQPDKIQFEHVKSITHYSGSNSNIRTAALIPLAPVAVVGWVAACMFSCGNDESAAGRSNENCPVNDSDIDVFRKTTKIVEVIDLKYKFDNYKSDVDPDTLKLILLKNPKDGPSRVVGDGELVLLMPTSDDEIRQALVKRALYFRAVRRRGLTKQCAGPWAH